MTATRNAITDWVVGSLWFNTTTTPAVLQRVVSIGPVVWENIRAGGSLIARQIITANGTVTLNAATVLVDLILVGGGGAGGGAVANTAPAVSAGTGGGGGEIRYAYSVAAASVDGQVISVGAGGTGVAGAAGNAGGNTTLAGVVAAGGPGGAFGATLNSNFPFGTTAKTSGSGGDAATGSFIGGPSFYNAPFALSGHGADCGPYGSGGAGQISTATGVAATGRGAAGGGGINITTAGAKAGGAGAGGLAIILEYS